VSGRVTTLRASPRWLRMICKEKAKIKGAGN
jgi:hypothetical protein